LRRYRWAVWLSVLSVMVGCAGGRHPQSASGRGDDLLQTGSGAYDVGKFEDAIGAWQEAVKAFDAAGDKAKQAEARVHLGAAQMMIGRYDLAAPTLTCAVARADTRRKRTAAGGMNCCGKGARRTARGNSKTRLVRGKGR
jgi:hypothetical protein